METSTRFVRIDDAIQKFTALLSEEPSTSVESYLDTVPADIRDDVGAGCRANLAVRRFFRNDKAVTPDRAGTLLGDYELLDEIGRGGAGIVYRARQRTLDRIVAVKVLRDDGRFSGAPTDRLLQEANRAGSLDHPGIVRVLSADLAATPPYFAMEYVDGAPLRAEIRRAASGLAPLSAPWGGLLPKGAPGAPLRAVRLVAELASAVAYAHANHTVHRDVKPENVVVAKDGRPRLIDFGLARLTDAATTEPHRLVGTAAYVSPEAARGEFVDGRVADAWALGVVLFELAAHRRPFESDDRDTVLETIRTRAAPRLRAVAPGVSSDLDRIVATSLAPDSDDRYPTVAAFENDLRRFLAGEPPLLRDATLVGAAARHVRKRKRVYVAAAFALLAWFVVARIQENARNEATWRGRMEPFAAFSGSDAFERTPSDQLSVLRDRAEELRREADAPTDALNLLSTFSDAVEAEGRDRAAKALSALREATAVSEAGTPLEGRVPILPAVFDAYGKLVFDGRVADERSIELANAAVAARITLHVDGAPPGATVDAFAVEPGTGARAAPLFLAAPAPLEDVRLPAGMVFLRVRVVGRTTGELVRHYEMGRSYIERVASVPADRSGMASVPAGSFPVGGRPDDPHPIYKPRTFKTAGFDIDIHETTNEEYGKFLLAHPGRKLPARVSDVAALFEPGRAKLPVVGVSFIDAAAYAEWRGKRLPTWIEWQIAARGAEGLLAPPAYETVGPNEFRIGNAEPRPKGPAPVGTTPADVSPFGVRDLFGNVAEWTCTPYVAYVDGAFHPHMGNRIVQGGEWRYPSSPDGMNLGSIGDYPHDSDRIGFRCVATEQGP
jgi:formylglycine-generating enzyme required for sulfatase activity